MVHINFTYTYHLAAIINKKTSLVLPIQRNVESIPPNLTLFRSFLRMEYSAITQSLVIFSTILEMTYLIWIYGIHLRV